MLHTILLVCHNGLQIYIFHTLKNIAFHILVDFFELRDQLLDLHTLRAVLIVTACTGVCELAGTLDKMKPVIIAPCLDIVLPHEIKRADQLHSLKICAVELRHHRLDLGTI
mgnify:CR=1 FL=1